MWLNKMKEQLTGLKKDIETLQHTFKELHDIMYKDHNSIVNRLNMAQARIDVLAKYIKDNRVELGNNTRDIAQMANVVNKNTQSLERIVDSMDKDYEKRSKFYYALLVPIIIALLPTIINFFAINKTETDIDKIMYKLDKMEQRYE